MLWQSITAGQHKHLSQHIKRNICYMHCQHILGWNQTCACCHRVDERIHECSLACFPLRLDVNVYSSNKESTRIQVLRSQWKNRANNFCANVCWWTTPNRRSGRHGSLFCALRVCAFSSFGAWVVAKLHPGGWAGLKPGLAVLQCPPKWLRSLVKMCVKPLNKLIFYCSSIISISSILKNPTFSLSPCF